jgi:hypothetical protein
MVTVNRFHIASGSAARPMARASGGTGARDGVMSTTHGGEDVKNEWYQDQEDE